MMGPQAAWLQSGQGRRLHLQHGPIDLVIEAFGTADAEQAAYTNAWARFQTILDELVAELPLLRQPLGDAHPLLRGRVARRMAAACWPHRSMFITPMAAVAGSVAEEIIAVMAAAPGLRKAYVNNGGDIALLLEGNESFTAGVVGNVDQPHIDARAEIRASTPCRGIATSGWRGRSFSLGIADAVTVLARSASEADAAATVIANAVNADHPAITRRVASDLQPDSDLGDLLVTENVSTLPIALVLEALSSGAAVAHDLRRKGLVQAAYLSLQGETHVVGGEAMLVDRAGGVA